MTISARVLADSCQEGGRHRLTTFVLRYPRFIHSEFMTHRVFSRNAASSRAIPVAKMIQAVKDDPAMPVFWGKNQSGMQAAQELGMTSIDLCRGTWLAARDKAIDFAQNLLDLGLHKQIANRILEPWMHIEVVATSTCFANFYALRDHPMAQPEFQDLARKMRAAQRESTPKVLKPGEWHLPFVDPNELDEDARDVAESVPDGSGMIGVDLEIFGAMLSAARCARVSYLNHDGTRPLAEEDMRLYDRLMGGTPKHASPTEHQARVPILGDGLWGDGGDIVTDRDGFEEDLMPYLKSNLEGWVQFRKLIKGENITKHEEFEM